MAGRAEVPYNTENAPTMNAPPSPELTPHLKEADRGATVPADDAASAESDSVEFNDTQRSAMSFNAQPQAPADGSVRSALEIDLCTSRRTSSRTC